MHNLTYIFNDNIIIVVTIFMATHFPVTVLLLSLRSLRCINFRAQRLSRTCQSIVLSRPIIDIYFTWAGPRERFIAVFNVHQTVQC